MLLVVSEWRMHDEKTQSVVKVGCTWQPYLILIKTKLHIAPTFRGHMPNVDTKMQFLAQHDITRIQKTQLVWVYCSCYSALYTGYQIPEFTRWPEIDTALCTQTLFTKGVRCTFRHVS